MKNSRKKNCKYDVFARFFEVLLISRTNKRYSSFILPKFWGTTQNVLGPLSGCLDLGSILFEIDNFKLSSEKNGYDAVPGVLRSDQSALSSD